MRLSEGQAVAPTAAWVLRATCFVGGNGVATERDHGGDHVAAATNQPNLVGGLATWSQLALHGNAFNLLCDRANGHTCVRKRRMPTAPARMAMLKYATSIPQGGANADMHKDADAKRTPLPKETMPVMRRRAAKANRCPPAHGIDAGNVDHNNVPRPETSKQRNSETIASSNGLSHGSSLLRCSKALQS